MEILLIVCDILFDTLFQKEITISIGLSCLDIYDNYIRI